MPGLRPGALPLGEGIIGGDKALTTPNDLIVVSHLCPPRDSNPHAFSRALVSKTSMSTVPSKGQDRCASPEIRTQTVRVLKPLPLPLG